MSLQNILILVISSTWLILFIAGRAQYERVKEATLELILEEARRMSRRPGGFSVEQIYAKIQPAWEELVRKKAWFVLHKSELFPIPATPERLRKRMNFTPAWLGAYLRIKGFACTAEPELEEQIERIRALAPRRPAKS